MRAKLFATALLVGIIALAFGFSGSAVSADKYPSRTITWLIPYGPAGGFDLHSRAMIIGMKKALGVNIIIRNRPGAGGNIAWNLTWGAKPDGYTITTINIPGAIVSELFGTPTPEYRLKEFSWIGQISAAPYMWAVGAKTPFKTLEDFRSAKEVLVTGSGVGGTEWVTSTLTGRVMKFNIKQILGFPSAPAANMAIVRGEGHARGLGLDSPGQMAFVHDGTMRPMWVYLDKRDPDFPNVPTVGELGYPGLSVLASHRVVAAPPGMPKDRLALLQKAFDAATRDPEVLERFKKMKARIEPVVGEDWNNMLGDFYGLIQEHGDVFKAALQK
ncbi:MAG: tripartite tricarboxylate transporter substrate binding protein [Deltaproteobacteria bacterium]|nr:tripartite tricarboxylate transporter substrate binding protein [Deltaproteobacteria bacterium]